MILSNSCKSAGLCLQIHFLQEPLGLLFVEKILIEFLLKIIFHVGRLVIKAVISEEEELKSFANNKHERKKVNGEAEAPTHKKRTMKNAEEEILKWRTTLRDYLYHSGVDDCERAGAQCLLLFNPRSQPTKAAGTVQCVSHVGGGKLCSRQLHHNSSLQPSTTFLCLATVHNASAVAAPELKILLKSWSCSVSDFSCSWVE